MLGVIEWLSLANGMWLICIITFILCVFLEFPNFLQMNLYYFHKEKKYLEKKEIESTTTVIKSLDVFLSLVTVSK